MTAVQGIVGFREFLVRRDGEADPVRHTLSLREEFFAQLAGEPVRSAASIDRRCYLDNLKRQRIDPDIDRRVLWLLACAKVNLAERFGVGLAELHAGWDWFDGEAIELMHVRLQEHYHTRILSDVIAMFGLPFYPVAPNRFVRCLVKAMLAVPERLSLPLIGASEMAGCLIFRELRDMGEELFGEEPAVANRIRVLFNEILADEIGHVGYIAARLGNFGRRVMRMLYRRLGSRMAETNPEYGYLLGRDHIRKVFKIPFDVERFAADLPGLAYTAARI